MNYRHVLWLLLVVLPLACGGDGDDGPVNPDPGDGTVVLLSAADPADWSCTLGNSECLSCRIENGVMATHDTTRLYTLPYYPYTSSCLSQAGACRWASTERLDFRPYTSARLQFQITVALLYRVGGYENAHISVGLLSNVPGTPNLNLVDENFFPDVHSATWSKPYDISLENALRYSEATVIVAITYWHRTSPSPTQCEGASEAYIRDFKIVARP